MRRLVLLLCLFAVMALVPAAAKAQYVIGSRDLLQITVWQKNSLDRQVAVRQDGYITFPPIGDVLAAGLTTEQLSEQMQEMLFAYTRGPARVTIAVMEPNSRFVIVNGFVAQAGRYPYESIPSLFKVIAHAGGPVPGANLAAVRVTSTDEQNFDFTTEINLEAFLNGDTSVFVPDLKTGDVIYVPGAGLGLGGVDQIPGTAAPSASTISILGAVNRPGTYPVGQAFALPEVLGLAGGLSEFADLTEIRVLSRDASGSEVVATLDLEEIFRAGEPLRYPIRPGDALYIMPKNPSLAGKVATGVLTGLSFSRDLLNFVLLFDVLKSNDNNNGN